MRVLSLIVSVAFAAAADDDVARAMNAARARASAGDVVAQFSVGAMLYYGSADTAQGIDWIRKAAAQRHAAAEFQMGQVYDFGFGAAQDDREALAWYRKAAEHGSAPGQRTVGEFYRKGRGVAADAATGVAPHQVLVEGVAEEPEAVALQLERAGQLGRSVVEAGHRPQQAGREESAAEQRMAPARQ